MAISTKPQRLLFQQLAHASLSSGSCGRGCITNHQQRLLQSSLPDCTSRTIAIIYPSRSIQSFSNPNASPQAGSQRRGPRPLSARWRLCASGSTPTHRRPFHATHIEHQGQPSISSSQPSQPPASIPASGSTAAATASSSASSHHKTVLNPQYDEDGKEMVVRLTERASTRLGQIMTKERNPDLVLRISVEAGGCHGFQYLMSLSDMSKVSSEEDTVFEGDGGARVVLDTPSLELLKGSKIDYTMELIGSQFKVVDNPKATSSCGCGTSFDIQS